MVESKHAGALPVRCLLKCGQLTKLEKCPESLPLFHSPELRKFYTTFLYYMLFLEPKPANGDKR